MCSGRTLLWIKIILMNLKFAFEKKLCERISRSIVHPSVEIDLELKVEDLMQSFLIFTANWLRLVLKTEANFSFKECRALGWNR